MDNVKRQTPDIYGLFVFSALVMMALSGCGGGGGGGGGSSRLAVTEPPASALPPRPSLSYGASYNTELNRLSALPQLKASTASYDGLETADGCTVAKCGEAKMRTVFGRGMVNLEKALQPIGTLSLQSNDKSVPLEGSFIDGGLVIDEAMILPWLN